MRDRRMISNILRIKQEFAKSIFASKSNFISIVFLCFSGALLLQGATLLVTLGCQLSLCLSVAKFHPKIVFTSKKIFPFSLFRTFLDVSCHPECSKIIFPPIFFHPKFVFNELWWSKARHNATKHSSLSVLIAAPGPGWECRGRHLGLGSSRLSVTNRFKTKLLKKFPFWLQPRLGVSGTARTTCTARWRRSRRAARRTRSSWCGRRATGACAWDPASNVTTTLAARRTFCRTWTRSAPVSDDGDPKLYCFWRV